MVNQKLFIPIKGCILTCNNFISVLQGHGIAISMDGKGRGLDNVFIERFWRSLKQEKIDRIDLSSVRQTKEAITEYVEFYNNHSLHQSLGYETRRSVYFVEEKMKNKVIKMPMDRMDKFCNSPTYQQAQQPQQNYT